MEQAERTDEELRAMARAALKAGKLPMPESEHGGTLQGPMGHSQVPILCIVCGGYMRQGHQSYRLTALSDQRLMHHPRCFDAWLAAARDELAELQAGGS